MYTWARLSQLIILEPKRIRMALNFINKGRNQPTYSCYGCGAPGVVRTKCPRCVPKIPTAAIMITKAEFCPIQNNIGISYQSMIRVDIQKMQATVYLDTDARTNVISADM